MNCPKCNRQMTAYYALKQFYCEYCPCTIYDKTLLHPDKVKISELIKRIVELEEAETDLRSHIAELEASLKSVNETCQRLRDKTNHLARPITCKHKKIRTATDCGNPKSLHYGGVCYAHCDSVR